MFFCEYCDWRDSLDRVRRHIGKPLDLRLGGHGFYSRSGYPYFGFMVTQKSFQRARRTEAGPVADMPPYSCYLNTDRKRAFRCRLSRDFRTQPPASLTRRHCSSENKSAHTHLVMGFVVQLPGNSEHPRHLVQREHTSSVAAPDLVANTRCCNTHEINLLTPECKGRGRGRSPRKPADHRYRLTRFSHAKIQGIEPGFPRMPVVRGGQLSSRTPHQEPLGQGPGIAKVDPEQSNHNIILRQSYTTSKDISLEHSKASFGDTVRDSCAKKILLVLTKALRLAHNPSNTIWPQRESLHTKKLFTTDQKYVLLVLPRPPVAQSVGTPPVCGAGGSGFESQVAPCDADKSAIQSGGRRRSLRDADRGGLPMKTDHGNPPYFNSLRIHLKARLTQFPYKVRAYQELFSTFQAYSSIWSPRSGYAQSSTTLNWCAIFSPRRAAQKRIFRGPKFTFADLPWHSWLVRHRVGVREALGSNPGWDMGGRKVSYLTHIRRSWVLFRLAALKMVLQVVFRPRPSQLLPHSHFLLHTRLARVRAQAKDEVGRFSSPAHVRNIESYTINNSDQRPPSLVGERVASENSTITSVLSELASLRPVVCEIHLIVTVQRHDGKTARFARRSDEALVVRVSVARMAPSLRDLERNERFGRFMKTRKEMLHICILKQYGKKTFAKIYAHRGSRNTEMEGVGKKTHTHLRNRKKAALKLSASLLPAPPPPPFPPTNSTGTSVAERLARSPPTKAKRVQSPAGSPDFRTWESYRTMPLVGGFPRGSPVSPASSLRRRSLFSSIIDVGSQYLAVKSPSPPPKSLHSSVNPSSNSGRRIRNTEHRHGARLPMRFLKVVSVLRHTLGIGPLVYRKEEKKVEPLNLHVRTVDIKRFIRLLAMGSRYQLENASYKGYKPLHAVRLETARKFRASRLAAVAHVALPPLSLPCFSASNAEKKCCRETERNGGLKGEPQKANGTGCLRQELPHPAADKSMGFRNEANFPDEIQSTTWIYDAFIPTWRGTKSQAENEISSRAIKYGCGCATLAKGKEG
ncbi:hypothetical protein PR048_021764 [Dryococelus australis]|uniref:Uncharacterized protein n=1 Tax=Dryococelus australis TaxID=614101 RepID=A0ABQ9GZ69_9NEOP|nr:hypothetical protein PR048_021764 [Dryococelus australis]